MNFSIRRITRALAAPEHRSSCARALWLQILSELAGRGEGSRESGAFLLGVLEGRRRRVTGVVYYDDLDAAAYSTGVCVLEGDAFARLWQLCRQERLTVVGDVHTHPGRAVQSEADRTNPMVAREGHMALIVPNFAQGSIPCEALGIYEYRGGHTWTDYSGKAARRIFYQGFWS